MGRVGIDVLIFCHVALICVFVCLVRKVLRVEGYYNDSKITLSSYFVVVVYVVGGGGVAVLLLLLVLLLPVCCHLHVWARSCPCKTTVIHCLYTMYMSVSYLEYKAKINAI